MIADPKWFSPRKYGGWGATPNCWQGWAYIGLVILPFIIIPLLHLPGFWSTGLMIVWAIIFSFDLIHIMLNLKKDERDTIHEALAERNAMWFMVTILALGFAYQTAAGIINGVNQIDPIIIVAIFGALIVKAATHWYLRDK